MAAVVSELLEKVKDLTVEDRALLLDSLLQSFQQKDESVEQNWLNLALKRKTEVENNPSLLIPAEEVFAQISQALKK